jgi:ribosomal protein L29
MKKNLNDLSKEELIEYVEELRTQLNNEKYGLYFDRKSNPEKIVEECM